MRKLYFIPALALTLGTFSLCALHAAQPNPSLSTPPHFFERLDVNQDGMVTIAEAPAEGKMLVEFLLSRSGKKKDDSLSRPDFMRLVSSMANRRSVRAMDTKAAQAALGQGEKQPAPENCPACAMGLTAEFVFQRLDVNQDKLVTVTEFRRSPGMEEEAKAREVVGRLDQDGDNQLSWQELDRVYQARHANCQKPDPATLSRQSGQGRPDGRGDGNRFAQVFILRNDQNGDRKIDPSEFRGGEAGFQRLDKNKNGFIEVDELGELHQRRLADPKSMRQRLEEGQQPRPAPAAKEPNSPEKKE